MTAIEAADRSARRTLPTPEGVNLEIRLASRGDRLGAVALDLAIIFGLLAAVWVVAAIAFATLDRSYVLGTVLVASFLVRSFYFVVFELRGNGTTPGKRALGIQVVNRAGGPLRPGAVLARNLMREVELFLPIMILWQSEGWQTVLALGWAGAIGLLPLFNRDRLRAGDIVAGTIVIERPATALLPDLARSASPATYRFTPEQLEVYGSYELQVLEQVLRATGADAGRTRFEVAEQIQKKLDWRPAFGIPVETLRFLEEFYAALRQHLETRLLFGRRRRDKYDR